MGLFSNGKCKSKARLDGKTAVITGGNNGIGYETSLELLKRGCRVVIACRSPQRGNAAAEKLLSIVPEGQVRVVTLDLSSLNSVKTCALLLINSEPAIHLLINNAGMIQREGRQVTEDGYESTFQVNHLSHFLFTNLLLDRIKDCAPARIINVSSLLHYNSKVDFQDLQGTRSFDGMKAYGQSKLCNILFTLELQQRLKGSGVTVYSLHPGGVDTDILNDSPGCMGVIMRHSRWMLKTPEDGAQTTLHCALDEKLAEQKGLYYSDCKEASASTRARNTEDASKLWHVSEELVQNFLITI